MKRNKKCMKCGGTDITSMPVGKGARSGDRPDAIRAGWLADIPMRMFVCVSCGYVETWMSLADAKKLERLESGED